MKQTIAESWQEWSDFIDTDPGLFVGDNRSTLDWRDRIPASLPHPAQPGQEVTSGTVISTQVASLPIPGLRLNRLEVEAEIKDYQLEIDRLEKRLRRSHSDSRRVMIRSALRTASAHMFWARKRLEEVRAQERKMNSDLQRNLKAEKAALDGTKRRLKEEFRKLVSKLSDAFPNMLKVRPDRPTGASSLNFTVYYNVGGSVGHGLLGKFSVVIPRTRPQEMFRVPGWENDIDYKEMYTYIVCVLVNKASVNLVWAKRYRASVAENLRRAGVDVPYEGMFTNPSFKGADTYLHAVLEMTHDLIDNCARHQEEKGY